MISEDIITESATVHIITHGIIENIINDYCTLERENVLEIKEVNKQLSNGQPYAVLVDSGMYTTISKEARELLASKEFADNNRQSAFSSLSRPSYCGTILYQD